MLDWLYPSKCSFCGAAAPSGSALGVCAKCVLNLPFYESAFAYSDRRGGEPGADGGTGAKAQAAAACDAIVCAFRYEGLVRSALMRFKFNDKPEIGRTLAAFLCEKLERVFESEAVLASEAVFEREALSGGGVNRGGVNLGDVNRGDVFDLVTCVPQTRARELSRGYNQAGVIARVVAKRLRAPYSESVLARSPAASRQSRLRGGERAANAALAYSEGKTAALASGARVLLVDDVATTMSTLNVCASILKRTGAKTVVGAVAAARSAKRG